MKTTVSAGQRRIFDKKLEAILESLPEFVREHLNEISVVVEDEPSIQILKDMKIYAPGEWSDLCGLHHGIAITERSVTDPPLSTAIYIFRGPIFRLVDEDTTLEEEIRNTVIHELAHHFGFDDDELEELGYG